MNHRLLASINPMMIGLLVHAQCPMGIIHINSQADADAFATNYPSCIKIPGSLYINGPDITDLSPFNGLTRIDGTLQFWNLPLTNIGAFNDLSVIGGELWIAQCDQLTSLTGFATLDTVG